jgi:outer membrane lipoprotein-sorting protein
MPGVCLLLASACATHRFVPPTGPGAPAPEFASQFEQATKACRDIRGLTADASLSGRVGGQKVRANLVIGLADPNAVRLEAVAPFGAPLFVLAAQNGSGTLLLPRDKTVVRDTPADAIIEAIAGIKLTPDELRAVATGCVSPAASATGGSRYPGELTAITLKDGAIAYVRPVRGIAQIVSAKREGLIVEYEQFANGLPHRISLRAEAAGGSELALTLSQIELNPKLGPQAFAIDVPPETRAITLDDLRKSGPFGRGGGQ